MQVGRSVRLLVLCRLLPLLVLLVLRSCILVHFSSQQAEHRLAVLLVHNLSETAT